MTAYALALRFVDELKELPGTAQHPYIQWSHMLCGLGPDSPDEVAWCSSWVNSIAWLLDLPRSKSAAARSWLKVGAKVELIHAQVGFDVVVLQRGAGPQPGPLVLNAAGHVGFFAGFEGEFVLCVGGNQSNAVTRQKFPLAQVLGVRRLA